MGERLCKPPSDTSQGELNALELRYTPSAANFLLVEVGDAKTLRHALLERHGIIVRDCASFGLPQHIRIGIRTTGDCERLVAALRETLN